MAREWSVAVEAHGDAFKRNDEDLADNILDAFSGRSPSVRTGHGHLSFRFDVQADNAKEAFKQAWVLVRTALPTLEPNWMCLETVEDLKNRLMEPYTPDLVGVAEVAKLLGVTKQRASDLVHADHFPPPVATLAAGPIWRRSQLARFANSWPRRPGRPRRQAQPA